jgi:hypothetical protein
MIRRTRQAALFLFCLALAGPPQAAPLGGPVGVVTVSGGAFALSSAAQKPKPLKKRKLKAPAAAPPDRTPSGETVTDRERRLARECRGRPNAGACAGHTGGL